MFLINAGLLRMDPGKKRKQFLQSLQCVCPNTQTVLFLIQQARDSVFSCYEVEIFKLIFGSVMANLCSSTTI